MKSFLKQVYFYLRYPNQFYSDFYSLMQSNKARKLNIQRIPPNYILFDRFTEDSVFIDVGCGYMAELSQFLIQKYKLTAYAVDPTEKHASDIRALVNKYSPHLIHIPYAITSTNEEIVFFETLDHESGSLYEDHCHITRDRIRKYKVQGRNLSTLLKELGLAKVDLLKLDLEGAEYELIANLTAEDIRSVDQVFIEFHHHAFKRIHRKDTRKAVSTIKSLGFKAFTLDSHNYLFYRDKIV